MSNGCKNRFKRHSEAHDTYDEVNPLRDKEYRERMRAKARKNREKQKDYFFDASANKKRGRTK